MFQFEKLSKPYLRDFIIQRIPKNGRILDLACGNSPFQSELIERIGCDYVPGNGVDVIADAHSLPFKSSSFDTLICLEALEHFHSPAQSVKEISRVLRSEGTLIMTIPFCYPVHEAPYDFQRFTAYGLKKLISPYFKDIEIGEIFNESQTLGILLQRITYQSEMAQFKKIIINIIAKILFYTKFFSGSKAYQNIDKTIEGAFFTANYYLIATRKEK